MAQWTKTNTAPPAPEAPRWVKPARKLPGAGVELSLLKCGVFVLRIGNIRNRDVFTKANDAIKALPRHLRKFDMETKYWTIQPEGVGMLLDIFEEFSYKSELAKRKFEEVTGKKAPAIAKRTVRDTSNADYGRYKMKTTPKPYQPVSLDVALETNFRFLLGDEMGLGKTKQIIDLMGYRRENLGNRLFLVACPVSLKINWQDEFLVHSEYGGHVHVMPSDKKARMEFIVDVKRRILTTQEMVIVVANYEQFRIEDSFFLSVPWDFVACDEAHRLKNRSAQVTQLIFEMVNGLPPQAAARRKVVEVPRTRVVLATGTPIANTPADLFSLVNIIDPNVFGNWTQFVSNFCDMGGFNGREIVGFRNLPQLREIVQKVMLRRLKEEVAKDLPPKMYQNILVELSSKQRKRYDELKKEFKLGNIRVTNPLTQMMIFRQLCAGMQYVPGYEGPPDSAKFDTLLEILDGTDEKVVIWDEFKKTGIDIAKKLGKGTVLYNGDMSVEEKDKAKRAFQEGDAKRFIGTIAAGGVGLTLTASHTEIFYGRTWQPAMNLQAEDRCHRIGQKDNVQIINLICRGTIEQNIIGALIEKQASANSVLGEDRPLFSDPASFLELL